MDDEKILLKLGGSKHLGEERWRGALTLFDKVYCACTYREPEWTIKADDVQIMKLERTPVNKLLIGTLVRTKYNRSLSWLNAVFILLLRIFNPRWMSEIKKLNPSRILCSYGDYDMSDLTYLVARPVLSASVVRSLKESRTGFNYMERNALKYADTIALYDAELQSFLERKYGSSIFANKRVIIGYDENFLPSCIIDNIRYQEKLSAQDNKTHLVILSFRADSAPNRARDQNRYYYIDIIQKMIDAGIVVHLHCAKYNNVNGVNRYEELAERHRGWFYMEPPLKMAHDSTAAEWIVSCETLSRYDVGLLHNIVDGSSVSEFDRINIPHRYYAYEAAHVAPIIRRNENTVLERIFTERECGFIYDELTDIKEAKNHRFGYDTPCYEDYLSMVLGI